MAPHSAPPQALALLSAAGSASFLAGKLLVEKAQLEALLQEYASLPAGEVAPGEACYIGMHGHALIYSHWISTCPLGVTRTTTHAAITFCLFGRWTRLAHAGLAYRRAVSAYVAATQGANDLTAKTMSDYATFYRFKVRASV